MLVDKRGRKKPQWLRAELEAHLANECPKFTVQCKDCELRMPREDFENKDVHNCVANLNKLLEETRQKLADTEKNLADSKDEVKQLNEKIKNLERTITQK